MANASALKPKKVPWVPPPGRAHQKNKVPPKSSSDACVTITKDPVAIGVNHQKGKVHVTVGLLPSKNVSHEASTTFARDVDPGNLDTSSLSSVSSSSRIPQEINVHFRSIKQEMKLLTIHFMSLKQTSQFLNGFYSTCGCQDRSIRNLLSKIDDQIKEFIFNFDDLEYKVTLVENTIDESSKYEEYVKLVKLKEDILSKLLGSYSKVCIVFQTLLQKEISQHSTKAEQNQEVLRMQLQESEKRCASKNAVITDLERRISILQGKTNTMESYRKSLEETRIELQKQLSLKESQIKYLTTELSLANVNNTDENEKYFVIIEEMKKTAQAEKTALKKALKLQKSRVEKAEKKFQDLEKSLKDMEKMLTSIAAQRDQLKLHLTVANNSIIESKNQTEEMRSHNLKLQNDLLEKESGLQSHIQELSTAVKQKTTERDDCLQEMHNLEKHLKDEKANTELLAKELETAKSQYSDIKSTSGQPGDENALKEVKNLIMLLQDTKQHFQSLKFPMAAGDNHVLNNPKIQENHSTIATSVQEVKEQLSELKNLFSKEQKGEKQDIKIKELQQKYKLCSKENEVLKSEIEEIKSSKQHTTLSPEIENYPPTHLGEGDFTHRSLQMELRLKEEENWRLKQRERDLEHQLVEVKERLQKKEIETYKLPSLEEELKLRTNELTVLKIQKEEESKHLLNRIKELQETLNKTTIEHKSLELYVQELKASYYSVFADS